MMIYKPNLSYENRIFTLTIYMTSTSIFMDFSRKVNEDDESYAYSHKCRYYWDKIPFLSNNVSFLSPLGCLYL